MLDGLRNLFLRAIECNNCDEANALVEKWNDEIAHINRIFNRYQEKREGKTQTTDIQNRQKGELKNAEIH